MYIQRNGLAGAVLWALGMTAVATVGIGAASPASRSGEAVETIRAPRAVADAVLIIEKKYQHVITYEDPRYAYEGEKGDLVDVTNPSITLPPGVKRLADRVLDMKSRVVSFNQSAWPESARPEDVEALTQTILTSYAKNGVGTFRLLRTGATLHVIPTLVRNESGEWVDDGSILDVRLNFAKQRVSGMEALSMVTAALHANVDVGTLAVQNLMLQHQFELEAKDEPARSVLLRLFSSTGWPLSWHLYYGPDVKRYALNVHSINDGTPPWLKAQQPRK